jgi:hypothetical protein
MSHPLRSLRPKGGRKQAFRWTAQQHLDAAAFVRTPFFQQLVGTAAQISEKEILTELGSTPDELRKSLGFGSCLMMQKWRPDSGFGILLM